jgi:hypothetical protein
VIAVFQQDSQAGVLGEVASHANPKFSMKSGIPSGFAKVRFDMLATKIDRAIRKNLLRAMI